MTLTQLVIFAEDFRVLHETLSVSSLFQQMEDFSVFHIVHGRHKTRLEKCSKSSTEMEDTERHGRHESFLRETCRFGNAILVFYLKCLPYLVFYASVFHGWKTRIFVRFSSCLPLKTFNVFDEEHDRVFWKIHRSVVLFSAT